MEKINIGCKLPHGLLLEFGLAKNGIPGKDYCAVVLQGTLAARPGAKFGSTFMAKALWDEWSVKNANLRYLVDGSVFVIK